LHFLKCNDKTFNIVDIVKQIFRVGSGTGSGTFCRSSRIRIQIRIQNSEENGIRIRIGKKNNFRSTTLLTIPEVTTSHLPVKEGTKRAQKVTAASIEQLAQRPRAN
jgi:serine kinase of HPr protein (carbohydrate metabolism regulator)